MTTATRSAPPAAPPTGSKRIDAKRLAELAGRVTTAGDDRESIEVEKPATGDPLATVPRCTAEDVELAVDRARAAQVRWRESDFAERRRVLLDFHDLVLDRQDELLDILQLESGRHEVQNAYPRAVRAEGNLPAKQMLRDVFEVTDRTWRGIGMIPQSGWKLSDRYAEFDAERRFEVGDSMIAAIAGGTSTCDTSSEKFRTPSRLAW